MSLKKQRVDILTVEQGLAENTDTAKRLIMAGLVRTGDHVWNKAGELILKTTKLELKKAKCKYVSMGALKLEKALKEFNISAQNTVCLDIGSSTGGFTEVLLINGAKTIYAVDVGYGIMHNKLRNNKKIKLFERTNFRLLNDNHFNILFDLIVTDVSFISLSSILPKAITMLKNNGQIIALIKPQFEADKKLVPKGGIIKNKETHINVILNLQSFFRNYNLYLTNLTSVPLINKNKNIEFLSLWETSNDKNLSEQQIIQTVNESHSK